MSGLDDIKNLEFEDTEGEVRFRPHIKEIAINNLTADKHYYNGKEAKLAKSDLLMFTDYNTNGTTDASIKSNTRLINRETSNLKSGGIYYISNNDNDITLSNGGPKNNISILLPKVSINLLCQRKYNDGRAAALPAPDLKSEPNKLNMNDDEFNNSALKADIENFSGLYYEFILISKISGDGKIEICTVGHNHENDLSNIDSEKRPIIGAYPAFRAQISNTNLSTEAKFVANDGTRGRGGGGGGAGVNNITGTATPKDKRVRIPDKPISNGNDMFGYVLTKTTQDLFKNTTTSEITIPQLLSSPDMTDVGDLYFNNRPDTHDVNGGVLETQLEVNYGRGNGNIEELFKKETFIYGDGAFPVSKTYMNVNALGKNYDLGNSRGFSKKILFCGTAKKGDRITCLHNGLHWYVEAHTSSDESFKRNNNIDYSTNLSTMVTRRVDHTGANFGRVITPVENPARLKLEEGLEEHTGGIIYY